MTPSYLSTKVQYVVLSFQWWARWGIFRDSLVGEQTLTPVEEAKCPQSEDWHCVVEIAIKHVWELDEQIKDL